jgi:hypothetical protein
VKKSSQAQCYAFYSLKFRNKFYCRWAFLERPQCPLKNGRHGNESASSSPKPWLFRVFVGAIDLCTLQKKN